MKWEDVHKVLEFGTKDPNTRIAMILIGLLIPLGACAAAAVKELNEASARVLVRDASKQEGYLISLAEIQRVMVRTMKDYTASTAPNGPEFILRRLIEEKLVAQRADIVSYPKISGTFKATQNQGVYEFVLETGPDSNVVHGTSSEQSQNMSRPSLTPVRTTVDVNGLFRIGQDSWLYQERDGTAQLLDQDRFGARRNYTGPASAQKVQMKWYEYAFTLEMQKQIVHEPKGPFRPTGLFGEIKGDFVQGGSFEVGEVTGLQLMLETRAVANVTWKLLPNNLGRIFLGDEKPSGKGKVQFAKKPDGTWVVVTREM